MILESAQMMSTAIAEHRPEKAPYKPTHRNHPANIWTRQTMGNYYWLYKHWIALNKEYTERYGKIHKSYQYLPQFTAGGAYMPVGKRTPFVNCARNKQLGLDFTGIKDVHRAYREYLSERFKTDKRPAVCKI